MKDLDEAIKHAEKVARIEEQACFLISIKDDDYDHHKKRGEQYRQLAEWLKDYKRLREDSVLTLRVNADEVLGILNDPAANVIERSKIDTAIDEIVEKSFCSDILNDKTDIEIVKLDDVIVILRSIQEGEE